MYSLVSILRTPRSRLLGSSPPTLYFTSTRSVLTILRLPCPGSAAIEWVVLMHFNRFRPLLIPTRSLRNIIQRYRARLFSCSSYACYAPHEQRQGR